ncbi:hypothetical protein [Aneurinibacillus aneurinilyticus]|uniref:Uncharacterized protein n=1 Tax=Aneurinibacillus aneurinilyticus TaxID=1391 RepID=A0A848D2N9_ANEAE|nr:hypothetical protein [Aneurinibacillus aneurinilyticus]MCI1695920.1 hypothetical protein [Aneurinibacillus aneurinilyticus]NMF00333.1 hypothetical protein [Aneurinibacillus aneurinilyticus]
MPKRYLKDAHPKDSGLLFLTIVSELVRRQWKPPADGARHLSTGVGKNWYDKVA